MHAFQWTTVEDFVSSICTLLRGVKSCDGNEEAVTAAILVWGLVFTLFSAKDSAKQRSLCIGEYIVDNKPWLIGADGEDGLL